MKYMPDQAILQNEARICDIGGKGVFLPIFSSEYEWPQSLRVMLYLFGLLWCFIGVSIGSDLFVSAIEKIVSTKRTAIMDIHGQKKKITIRVWNDTVANLTLMALGSSAPEILLATIEIFGKKFYSGELGPSTITGSAAFNLLLIIAICILSLPAGESKDIKDVSVFVVTSVSSVLAYFWVIFIVQVSSPEVIEIWEAVVTLLMFPLFVFISYIADKGYFSSVSKREDVMRAHMLGASTMGTENLSRICSEVRRIHGDNLSDEHVYRIINAEFPHRESRATYKALGRNTSKTNPLELTDRRLSIPKQPDKDCDSTIGFKVPRYAVMESAGSITLSITRKGNITYPVNVFISTIDATATHGKDFRNLQNQKFSIPAFVEEINGPVIDIYDDTIWEDDQYFYVKMERVEVATDQDRSMPSTTPITPLMSSKNHRETNLGGCTSSRLLSNRVSSDSSSLTTEQRNKQMHLANSRGITNRTYDEESDAVEMEPYVRANNLEITRDLHGTVGIDPKMSAAKVIIIDDDAPGVLKFEKETIEVCLSFSDVVHVNLQVNREGGAKGVITFDYAIESSMEPDIIEDSSGSVKMEDDETSKSLNFSLNPLQRGTPVSDFSVILSNPTGGSRFCSTTDGGLTNAICTVKIINPNSISPRIFQKSGTMLYVIGRSVHQTCKETIGDAVFIGGSMMSTRQASVLSVVWHIVILPWNLFFVIVPDAQRFGGWPTFWTSLCLVGLVTAVIGDLAELLGCVIPLPNVVTATVLVAVGTSIPDAFASRGAALHDKYADSSIGNVTGSNAVNVFLGLGLPWLIGSIYWSYAADVDQWRLKYTGHPAIEKYSNGAFIVKTGSLFFSVVTFSVCAIVCFALLYVRRKYYGGVLGGARRPRLVSACILLVLWIIYATATSVYAITIAE